MGSTISALDSHSALPIPRDRRPLSIQEIVRRNHGALIKFLRRRLSIADDAEDVAQETYIRMMRYEGSSELQSPSAMLFRIAVNVANDHGRTAVARRASKHTATRGSRARHRDAFPGAQRARGPNARFVACHDRGAAAEVQASLLAEPRQRHDVSGDRGPLRNFRKDGREAHQPRHRGLPRKGRGIRVADAPAPSPSTAARGDRG